MCYNSTEMARCLITLGGDSGYNVAGELKTDGKRATLRYGFDGDEYRIECIGGGLEYYRSGSVNLAMRFTEGESSVCLLSHNGLGGEIPVKTEYVRTEIYGCGLKINLKYEIGGDIRHLAIAAVMEK